MLKYNPDTQQMEDDGVPDPTAIAAPTLGAAPTDTGGGGGPVAAPSGPALAVIAPPEESHKVERTGPQTTATVPNAAEAQALGAMDTAGKAKVVAEDQKFEAQKPVLEAQADAAEKQAQLAQEAERQKAATRAAMDAEVKRLQAEAEKRRQEMEVAAHPTSYWEDKGTPAKILGGFLVGMQAFADGLVGNNRPNPVWEMYKGAEAQDRQRKIEAFTRTKEFHELAQQNITAAQQALAAKLKQIDDEAIVKGKVIDKQLEALSKRLGIPAAAAEHASFRANLEQENAEKLAKENAHFSTQVQSGRTTVSDTQNINKGGANGAPDLTALDANGKPYGRWRTLPEAEKGRDAQAALVGFRGAIAELNDHLREKGKLFNPASEAYAERQALVQNASRFLQKLNDAGVLNPGEYERNAKQLAGGLLQPADNAARANDLMIKSAERTYSANLQGKAVPGAETAQQEAAPAKPATAPAKRSNIETREINGKRYYRKGNDWFEL